MEMFHVKYKEEATELIETIEKSLLSMKDNPEDPALVEEVFRCMHNLKGNSAMFGFRVIADFTHHLESVYDLIRSGSLKISRHILDLSFSSLDHLSVLINTGGLLDDKNQQVYEELLGKVVTVIQGAASNTRWNTEINKNETSTDQNILTTYHIHFRPSRNFFLNGSNPMLLIDELQQLGRCEAVVNMEEVPCLEAIDPDKCYTHWDVYLNTDKSPAAIRDLFFYAERRAHLEIEAVPAEATTNEELVIASDNTANFPIEIRSIASTAENNKPQNKKQVISSIKVPSGRLDNMMSLVSELMTLQAKLGTLTEQNPQPELLVLTENLEKISTRLRDNAFSMCLVPVENMMTPFHRLVRDISAELNKEIKFVTEGTETELDKNIIEGLSDPLMHLLRNSIDHGIEDSDIRIKSGKPAYGKIIFRAFCAGTNVFIEIEDDGKGIDSGKIRRKAIEKGLISEENNLSDKEILNLVFLPGFSTAEQVSKISGRGVGMDVVKRKITDIRGQIKINSEVNVGTTITIKLPITVSIIDGLLVKINNADVVIPLSSVERCYEFPATQQLNSFNNLLVLDGEQVPFINLVEEFGGIENNNAAREIVITYYDDKRIGFIVDQVIGKFQAVLKPLGKYFSHMNNISGATILGDGKIALVLDTNNVTEQFLNKKNNPLCQYHRKQPLI